MCLLAGAAYSQEGDTSKEETTKSISNKTSKPWLVLPRFPGCEDLPEEERDNCAEKKQVEFIVKELQYPDAAQEKGIEGTVVIYFIVEVDGTITDAMIIEDLGGGCSEEALRVVNSMPKWTPGAIKGKLTPIERALFVKFGAGSDTLQKPASSPREIFTIVQEMPRFPGCEDMEGHHDVKKKCAQEKMLEYIYTNIQYPEEARKNKIQGVVFVSFVVEADGLITRAKILRSVGEEIDKEALRVINSMPKWTPGKQRNQPLRVQFTLPVRFKLEGVDDKKKKKKKKTTRPQKKRQKSYFDHL